MPPQPNKLTITASAYQSLQEYSHGIKFSWKSELRHLLSKKISNIFWWPLFKFRQKRFTRSPIFRSCMILPGFSDLWKTIQKSSFAYNALFLGITPFQHSSSTDIADITTLKLCFGDEFIDGITAQNGKPSILRLIQNDDIKFYLQKKIEADKVTVVDSFDLSRLLSQDTVQQTNEKYQISYYTFYGLIQGYLQLINERLSQLPFSIADKAADKIADTCNTYFKSFLHDVNCSPVPGNIPKVREVLYFHETKTAHIQKKLLELRCILMNKEQAMNSIHTPGWIDIMRVIQIYDDIHDIIIDDGMQDNIVLSIACHYFPDEWKWFETYKHSIKEKRPNPLLLSLYMPCSMEHCIQLAGERIKKMNWEQQKIMHYLLFKTKYVLYTDDEKSFVNNNDFLLQFYHKTKDRMQHLSTQAIKSFAIDTCIHLPAIRKQLLNVVGFSKAYQLKYNLLSLPIEAKASIFDSAITK
ncbi:MAG: hypothetical protein JJE22_13630 [Bacteroidia bacterium]|nr:hypothetical protein [Bacteroidia bacterium]